MRCRLSQYFTSESLSTKYRIERFCWRTTLVIVFSAITLMPVVSGAAGPAPQGADSTARLEILNESWVGKQLPDNYTLQLFVASHRNRLDEFVAQHSELAGPLGSFAQQRNGKRLYVLVQGSYSNRSLAEVAAEALPEQLQPWVRDFAGIKRVMVDDGKAEESANSTIRDTAWVWSQNPNHYTLQLLATEDEASIEKVLHDLSLPGDMAVVLTLCDNRPCYSLLYGRFEDKAAAEEGAANLPAQLKKPAPRLRRFSALQDEIGDATKR